MSTITSETVIARHNLAALKAEIKADAESTRALRNHAKTLFGMGKHRAHLAAKRGDYLQRARLLAYGYLRGRTISQMESASSHSFAIDTTVLRIAEKHFNKDVESFKDFSTRVSADLNAWKTQRLLATTLRVAAAEEAKRVAWAVGAADRAAKAAAEAKARAERLVAEERQRVLSRAQRAQIVADACVTTAQFNLDHAEIDAQKEVDRIHQLLDAAKHNVTTARERMALKLDQARAEAVKAKAVFDDLQVGAS